MWSALCFDSDEEPPALDGTADATGAFGAVADAVVAKGYGNRPAFVFRPTHVVLQRDAVSDGESGGEEPAKVEDLPVSDGESGAEETPCCLELEAVPGQT